MQVLGDEAARMAFVVPILNVPVIMPINVRSDTDYGLQISVNAISQTVALSSASLTVWGFPAHKEHDARALLPGITGIAPGLPGRARRSVAPKRPTRTPARPSGPSSTTRASAPKTPLPVSVDVTTYQDPNPTNVVSTYPGDDRLRKPEVRPPPAGEADNARGRRPGGTRPAAQSRSVPRRRSALAVDAAHGDPDPARRALGQPGRRGWTDRLHRRTGEFRTEPARRLPGQRKDRDGRSPHAGPRRPARRLALHRQAAARQPVPRLHDLRRLRDPRKAGRRGPSRSENRPDDDGGRGHSPGPVRGVRSAPVRLRPRADGDADAVPRLLDRLATSSPGTRASRRSTRRRS